MRALLKKSLVVLLIAVTALGVAACGSSKGTRTKDGDKTLFTYDGTKVPLKEAYIYAKMLGTNYEAQYSSYFGPDFWTMSISTDADGNTYTREVELFTWEKLDRIEDVKAAFGL